MDYYPNQRTSVKEKISEKWYIPNMRYWIRLAQSVNDKEATANNLNAANGIVDPKTYNYVLSPLQADGDKLKNLPGEIRNIDFITPIKEKNIGEYIDLPYQFTVKVNDPDIAITKSVDVANAIKPIIEQFMVAQVQQQFQMEEAGQEAPQVDIQAEINKIKNNWFDKRAIDVSNEINWINDINDFDNKRILGFYNWWATEEVYYYVYIVNGHVFFDVLSPLEGLPILAGEEFVEDGDAFVIKRRISYTQILTYYGNQLSNKDIEYIETLTARSSADLPVSIPVQLYKDIYNRTVFRSDNTQYQDNEDMFISSTDIIDENILFFKTQVKAKMLTRLNNIGELVSMRVDDDYVLNPEEGDIDIKTEWLTETWKQVLLGNLDSGIYLTPEPIEVQIYDNIGNVKLPIVGKKGLLRNININPVPKRILPSLALSQIINLHIERQLAKYKTPVEVIPMGLLNSTGVDVKGAMFYKLADNTVIYDETKFTPDQLNNAYKVIGNTGISSYIRDLIDLRESIKAEAWDLANMNDARFGQAAASATVRNNEQNLYRAKLGSILMTTMYNNVLAKLHNMCAEYGKVAYDKGLSGSLFGQEGDVNYFNIPGGSLSNAQVGVMVTNSVLEKAKLEEFKKLGFNASQNGDHELAAETISSDSVSSVRQAINKFMERKRQYETEMKQMEQQGQMQIVEEQQRLEQQKHEFRIAEIEKEQQLITEREIKVAEIKTRNNKEI
jgi:hypothetical protein